MSVFYRESIKSILTPIINNAYISRCSEHDLYKNTLDCFSCVIDAAVQGISIKEWMEIEQKRQIQKTLQNAIGNLHQVILGSLEGVQDLGVGGVVDLRCDEKQFIAEIKNKWNTTKGNHKYSIYDDLEKVLEQCPTGYTGYYVEILPKNKGKYNKPFTPPDNKTKTQRPQNEYIRVIDGYSFYELVTGRPDALKELYFLIAETTCEILREEFHSTVTTNSLGKSEIDDLFNKIF